MFSRACLSHFWALASSPAYTPPEMMPDLLISVPSMATTWTREGDQGGNVEKQWIAREVKQSGQASRERGPVQPVQQHAA